MENNIKNQYKENGYYLSKSVLTEEFCDELKDY